MADQVVDPLDEIEALIRKSIDDWRKAINEEERRATEYERLQRPDLAAMARWRVGAYRNDQAHWEHQLQRVLAQKAARRN
jgi:hypothetical protein